MHRRLALPLLVVLALWLAACGSETSDGATSTDGGAVTTTEAAGSSPEGSDQSRPAPLETVPASPSNTLADGTEATKPTVTIPDEDPPTDLVVKDLVVGTGEEAVAGKAVTVQYVGNSWSTGQEFDASWNRGEPFTFPLGAGRVIAGWDEGVEGMKVGGRRQLVIPPDKGYGSQGAGTDIGPDETLVFVVDLVSVD